MQDEYWLSYAVTAFLENFWYLIVACFGAIVGSFLGVVIYRLPIKELTPPDKLPKGYSLSNPPSYCPHCNHELQWWENVPIFGFLWLRGRCSDCKKPIPWRDFAMEILTACTWVAIFHRYNGNNLVDWVNVVLLALFASMLIAAVFIDLDHFIVPEELNRFGVIVGLLRDVAVLGVAFLLAQILLPQDWTFRWDGARMWNETRAAHTYFGWLPRGFVGALLYSGVLLLVNFGSFIYYAREENETVGAVVRRWYIEHFTDLPLESAPEGAEPVVETDAVLTPTGVIPPTALPQEVALAEASDPVTPPEEEAPPVRLRFSPGFITLLSAGMLSIVVGWWSLLVVALPLLAFVTLTRTRTETVGDALRRFFRADDLPYEYDAPSPSLMRPSKAPAPRAPQDDTLITGANVHDVVWNKAAVPAVAGVPSGVTVEAVPPPVAPTGPLSFAEAQAEADQFAKEAESGAHGGMGLGDVKLAIAIGAILGPAMAMLSLLFATFLGAFVGVALKMIHRKEGLRIGVPFVPFMAAGALIALLFGQQVLTWYASFYPSAAPEQPGITQPRLLPNGSVEMPATSRMRRDSAPRRPLPNNDFRQ